MSIDKNRFTESVNKHRQESRISDVLQLVHAAVPIDKVTQSPEWNSVLQLIQGMIDAEQAKYEDLHKKFVAPQLVNHDQIMLMKQQITASLSRISTLIEVRDLPKTVLDAAAKVKNNLT